MEKHKDIRNYNEQNEDGKNTVLNNLLCPKVNVEDEQNSECSNEQIKATLTYKNDELNAEHKKSLNFRQINTTVSEELNNSNSNQRDSVGDFEDEGNRVESSHETNIMDPFPNNDTELIEEPNEIITVSQNDTIVSVEDNKNNNSQKQLNSVEDAEDEISHVNGRQDNIISSSKNGGLINEAGKEQNCRQSNIIVPEVHRKSNNFQNQLVSIEQSHVNSCQGNNDITSSSGNDDELSAIQEELDDFAQSNTIVPEGQNISNNSQNQPDSVADTEDERNNVDCSEEIGIITPSIMKDDELNDTEKGNLNFMQTNTDISGEQSKNDACQDSSDPVDEKNHVSSSKAIHVGASCAKKSDEKADKSEDAVTFFEKIQGLGSKIWNVINRVKDPSHSVSSMKLEKEYESNENAKKGFNIDEDEEIWSSYVKIPRSQADSYDILTTETVGYTEDKTSHVSSNQWNNITSMNDDDVFSEIQKEKQNSGQSNTNFPERHSKSNNFQRKSDSVQEKQSLANSCKKTNIMVPSSKNDIEHSETKPKNFSQNNAIASEADSANNNSESHSDSVRDAKDETSHVNSSELNNVVPSKDNSVIGEKQKVVQNFRQSNTIFRKRYCKRNNLQNQPYSGQDTEDEANNVNICQKDNIMALSGMKDNKLYENEKDGLNFSGINRNVYGGHSKNDDSQFSRDPADEKIHLNRSKAIDVSAPREKMSNEKIDKCEDAATFFEEMHVLGSETLIDIMTAKDQSDSINILKLNKEYGTKENTKAGFNVDEKKLEDEILSPDNKIQGSQANSYDPSAADSRNDNTYKPKKPVIRNLLNTDIKIISMEDALTYFDLNEVLRDLDISLENVRKHRISKEQHRKLLKLADKEMQKLCLSFHPDKIISRGGCNEELEVAQNLQSALNMTRTVLNVITEEFLDNLHIYYKYEFFKKVELNSMGNEDQIRDRVTEVLLKIGFLSEIIREKIVAQIGKFLEKSVLCIENYINSDINNFEKNHYFATFYLKKCIEGYESLDDEFIKVQRGCTIEELDYMESAISKMKRINLRHLYILKCLQSNEKFLDGAITVFNNYNLMDDYFVLPFAYYVNILLMCYIVLREKLKKKKMETVIKKVTCFLNKPNSALSSAKDPETNEEVKMLKSAYYLVSHLQDNTRYKDQMIEIGKNRNIDRHNIIGAFNAIFIEMEDFLKVKFKINSYKVCSTKENFMKKLAQHNMDTMSDYQEAKNKLSEHMENFKKENEERKKEFHKMREHYSELEQRLADIQKRSSKLIDETSWELLNENCDWKSK